MRDWNSFTAAIRQTPTPDLTYPVLAAWTATQQAVHLDRLRRLRRWRLTLALIGLLQAGLAIALSAGAQASHHGHAVQESTSWEIALGVGFLVAAWQPWRAHGMAALVAIGCLGLAVSSITDITAGAADLAGEAFHLLAFAGLLALWRAGRAAPPRPVASADPAFA